MFDKLKEWYRKDQEYRTALREAEHIERLKNVGEEAKINAKARLERKKARVSQPGSLARVMFNKPNTQKPNNTGKGIMDLDF